MRYRVLIDRGGTFTDCLGIDPNDGSVRVAKVLSSDRAALDGIRRLLGLDAQAPLPPCDVRMGTTLATNALLERRGARTALVTTEGFGDILQLGDQTRPDLFALKIERVAPPIERVIELPARMDAAGNVMSRPDRTTARAALRQLRELGIESLAIAFLHAHRSGQLELEVGELAHELGFRYVALSHQVVSELGFLARCATTALDAYLTPVLREHMGELQAALRGSTLRMMQSSGGLVEASQLRGRDALLSGPAGGVAAVLHIARQRGLGRVIGFDMGGTSTDVSRCAGEPERVYETQVAGLTLRAPSLRIHTVAAGGGSICRFDGQRFRVGPESAGADPGPLCYGRPSARELTVTDVNLALGRLPSSRFPFPLERARVDAALAELARRLELAGTPRTALEVARGFFEVAVEHMAEAIREISIAQGHDVRDHALVAFGGAGGQHACAVARRLGIRELVFHPLAGVLSAFGMGVASDAWHGEADAGAVVLADDGVPAAFDARYAALEDQGRAHLAATASHAPSARCIRRVDLRHVGTESALTLALEPRESLAARFVARHRERYGYERPGHAIEVTTLRVEVVVPPDVPPTSPIAASKPPAVERAPVHETARLYLDAAFRDVPAYLRESLVIDEVLVGPAIILEATSTLIIDPGFEARLDADGCIVMTDVGAPARTRPEDTRCDPILLEVFANRFMSIARQMGSVLQRTALSTNIRERLDFSCALFDRDGELVANAPHIPVHLGAMSESVRAVLALHTAPAPGEVYATNAPDLGGSHLPDITVITPVFDRQGQLAFVTASRGHHADVGGITPGSMPPFSKTLSEEGIVLRGERIVRGGVLDEALVRGLFGAGPYPARDIDQNLGDLAAQVAANQTGARLLERLVDEHGAQTTHAYMRHVLRDAEAKVEQALRALPAGEHRFADAMDDGAPVVVTLHVDTERARMRVDFTGTSAEVAGNLNAPRAVTVAAVLYVLRALVGTPIPLNSGCLHPIELIIPERSLLAPSAGRAVVAGNVETSQRVVDVMLAALGKLAACQGTMNNLTFGNASFGYYETIAGGAGAGDGFAGASGVHTHMTNTRITDPEVLESRFPVRLLRFALRHGSGGRGRFPGGDGVVRELQALAPLEVSILSERRTRAPFGLRGGEPGLPGRNLCGERELPGRAQLQLQAGERIRIETPGGGGFGAPT